MMDATKRRGKREQSDLEVGRNKEVSSEDDLSTIVIVDLGENESNEEYRGAEEKEGSGSQGSMGQE